MLSSPLPESATFPAQSELSGDCSSPRLPAGDDYMSNPFTSTDAKYRRMAENMAAAFRGLPEDNSTSRDRNVASIGDGITEALKHYRISFDKSLPEDALRARWNELVGPAAPYSHASRIEGKALVIVTSHAVVRSEMMNHRAVIISRVRAVPGCEHIEAIKCRAG